MILCLIKSLLIKAKIKEGKKSPPQPSSNFFIFFLNQANIASPHSQKKNKETPTSENKKNRK